jgi:lipoprotein-anchoring transpeptidase ErfK/SrfK
VLSSGGLSRRLLLAQALAVSTSACTVAYKTDVLRQDVLTDAQQVIADMKINHGDMTIEAAVDRADTTYGPGQPVVLSVKPSKDAYVAILRVLANGDTTIVFPNRGRRNAAVAANTVLTVPAAGDSVTIAVGKPGIELYEFIASTSKDAWPFTRTPDDGSDFANLGGSTRNTAKDLLGALKVGPSHDTAARYVTVRVSGRGLF